jgi:hypothetical protein
LQFFFAAISIRIRLREQSLQSLYSRLFKYRARQERGPREDFLSEALCDLLSRLPLRERIDRIANFFVPTELRAVWVKAHADATNVSLNTQRHLGGEGIADIVVEANDKVAIIIENKIGAPVHGDGEETQLHRYLRWLVHRFQGSNHIRQLGRVCRTRCGRQDGG